MGLVWSNIFMSIHVLKSVPWVRLVDGSEAVTCPFAHSTEFRQYGIALKSDIEAQHLVSFIVYLARIYNFQYACLAFVG
jgi:hypothetical protein